MKTRCCTSSEQYPLTIQAENYRMQFATTGKLVSFLNAKGAEQLDTGDPGKSFYLLLNMQHEIPLCELELLDGSSLEELYEGAEVAKKSGCNEVYQ